MKLLENLVVLMTLSAAGGAPPGHSNATQASTRLPPSLNPAAFVVPELFKFLVLVNVAAAIVVGIGSWAPGVPFESKGYPPLPNELPVPFSMGFEVIHISRSSRLPCHSRLFGDSRLSVEPQTSRRTEAGAITTYPPWCPSPRSCRSTTRAPLGANLLVETNSAHEEVPSLPLELVPNVPILQTFDMQGDEKGGEALLGPGAHGLGGASAATTCFCDGTPDSASFWVCWVFFCCRR